MDRTDSVRNFLEARTAVEIRSMTPAAEMYAAYASWFEDRSHVVGDYMISNTQFGRELAKLGVRKIRNSRGNFYPGLQLQE